MEHYFQHALQINRSYSFRQNDSERIRVVVKTLKFEEPHRRLTSKGACTECPKNFKASFHY